MLSRCLHSVTVSTENDESNFPLSVEGTGEMSWSQTGCGWISTQCYPADHDNIGCSKSRMIRTSLHGLVVVQRDVFMISFMSNDQLMTGCDQ